MKDQLHARLDELERKISETRRVLDALNSWHDGHHLTAGELEARHAFLKAQLEGEITDLEAHGHHVSRLEASLRQWVDGVDL